MKPGDLLLASLETSDGGSKIRPVILLDTIPPYGDLLVCAVSSQLRLEVPGLDEVIGPQDEDYVSSGLRLPSLVRTGQLAVKRRSLFHGRIGRIRCVVGIGVWLSVGGNRTRMNGTSDTPTPTDTDTDSNTNVARLTPMLQRKLRLRLLCRDEHGRCRRWGSRVGPGRPG